MSDIISVTGLIATTPRFITTSDGTPIISFRMATSQRRYDKSAGKWVDASTNWYTVTGFRQLANNCSISLNTGDRIIVSGRLRVKDWTTDERSGTTIEIEAEVIGHDLFWSTAVATRVGTAHPAEVEPELV